VARKYNALRWLSGGEPDMRPFLRRLCRDYGLQRDHNSLATLAWQWYEPRTEHLRLSDDVIATLATLAANEIELSLVINTPWQGQVIDQHLDSLGLLEFFPVRICSSEIGARKPDPRLFQAALDAMQVSAGETLAVGAASNGDLLAAQRLGMTSVLRSRYERANSSADYVIHNIADLLKLAPLAHVRARPRPIAPPIPQLIV
jgi:putative hydrolase of the HAD superfamily